MEGLPGVCVLGRADLTSEPVHQTIVNLLDGKLADAVIRCAHRVNSTMFLFPLSVDSFLSAPPLSLFLSLSFFFNLLSLFISDMAPNASGVRSLDHQRIMVQFFNHLSMSDICKSRA